MSLFSTFSDSTQERPPQVFAIDCVRGSSFFGTDCVRGLSFFGKLAVHDCKLRKGGLISETTDTKVDRLKHACSFNPQESLVARNAAVDGFVFILFGNGTDAHSFHSL